MDIVIRSFIERPWPAIVGEQVSQKVIGLIGGMNWESSAEYYCLIN